MPLRGVQDTLLRVIAAFFAVGGLSCHPNMSATNERPNTSRCAQATYALRETANPAAAAVLSHHWKCTYSVYRPGGLQHATCVWR
jgi:hypothetical protein